MNASKIARLPALVSKGSSALDAPAVSTTIYFDVSDLLLYLLDHATLSGIQRVQCEFLCNLLDVPNSQPLCFVIVNQRGELGEIDTVALLNLLEEIRSANTSRADIQEELRGLLNRVVPRTARSRDVFVLLGAFWAVKGMGILLQRLKNSGVIIGVFIHDILPISTPEYFEARATRVFVKGVTEVLTFADFILTTSEYNRASLAQHFAARKLEPLPVHLVPLGHELSHSKPSESKISDVVATLAETGYVMCVGTIEVRKNPGYLFNIWKMMVRSGRPNIPYLVFAGRKGWLVQDFMDQLRACNYLGGKILVMHNVTDVELDLLYRKCILTMFPSFVEGWGLPVGESLAHRKICLCSRTGGVPEVGGEPADFIDPYNVSEGLEQLLRYLDDEDIRHNREREIAERFQPRTWPQATEHFLRSVQMLARQIRPFEGTAAMLLPPDRYLPISSEAAELTADGLDGGLSAEVICISGWRPPELSGVRAAKQATMIRFRAALPVDTRINLVMRLVAHGRDFRLLIRSGSGARTEVSLAAGSERVVALPCQVEPGNLVTAHLSMVSGTFNGNTVAGASYWKLNGVLYFAPANLAAEAFKSKGFLRSKALAAQPAPTQPREQPEAPESATPRDRIVLRRLDMDNSRRAPSFGAFLQTTDCYWPSEVEADRDAPIFADRSDRRAFYAGCGNSIHLPQVGRIVDRVKLTKRSEQFISMERFSEGSVFDRSGVSKGLGFLKTAPAEMARWMGTEEDGVWVSEEALATAPYYDHSCLLFFNGNLQNYYHWVVEGLLCLDILSRSLGLDSKLKILLPKSADIAAVFDHRATLRAAGFDRYEPVVVAAGLIKVREAIWVDSDLMQAMPGPYLKDFQQRISAMYAHLRTPRNRRLLVARKGHTRKIQNFEQLQTFLSRYGFETVYLEGMSMVDQILLFQSAEFVIGPHGAGLSNLLFCEPGTKVIELMPSMEMRPFFWLISEKLDLIHGMQFCAPADGHDFQASITVDVAKLEALIRMLDAHL